MIVGCTSVGDASVGPGCRSRSFAPGPGDDGARQITIQQSCCLLLGLTSTGVNGQKSQLGSLAHQRHPYEAVPSFPAAEFHLQRLSGFLLVCRAGNDDLGFAAGDGFGEATVRCEVVAEIVE